MNKVLQIYNFTKNLFKLKTSKEEALLLLKRMVFLNLIINKF